MTQAIFLFVSSSMMVDLSSKRVSCFIYFSYSSMSYSLISGSLLGYFLMIGNAVGMKFLVDWVFWET